MVKLEKILNRKLITGDIEVRANRCTEMMTMLWKTIWGALKSPEVIIAVIIFLLALFLVNGLTHILPLDNKYYSDDKFLENMLANANTMIFDIAVVLVMNTFLLKIAERRRKIKDYFYEINDFRGWKSEVASRRIRGIIFRLNDLGVTRINLNNCYLKKADLSHADLSEAYLSWADLSRADLYNASLCGATLNETNLSGSVLWCANLSKANLGEANLSKTNFDNANLSRANLYKTNLCGAYLVETNFSGAYLHTANLHGIELSDANFSRANLQKANLREADLSKVDLSYADLSGADLSGAYLNVFVKGIDTVNLTDAVLDEQTRQLLMPINKTVK